MRRSIVSICLVLCAYSTFSQSFPTDTVVKKGALNKRINFVYLSDGYLLSELNTFTTDVIAINNKLFQTTPYKEYINYFNIFQVRVPSAEAGAKHANSASDCPAGASQPTIDPKNYFGSKFDFAGIHRLLVPDSMAKVSSVLFSNLPAYDQAFVLAHSTYYGGSGGSIATSSTDPNSAEVAIHELGHSFGKLGDEYWAGPQYAGEKPNMTAQSDPLQVKWKNWVGANNVGVFPFVGGPAWFRPVQGSRCKMEVLGVNFCSVCIETTIERIHSLVSPIDKFAPANATPITTDVTDLGFKLNLILPIPNTLKTTWTLDGNTIGQNVDTVTLTASMLAGGNHILLATVVDTTELSRSVTHSTTHTSNIQWNISKVTGVTSPELFRANLQVFPNPVASDLFIKYELEKKANVSIELISMDGKRITRHEKKNQLPGQYNFTIDTKKLAINSGMYFVVFSLNGNSLTREVVKVE
ncbi:MAG: M64 family metallopeptidase [Chitinophagaceae bacterium]